jgi:hypothetical protein
MGALSQQRAMGLSQQQAALEAGSRSFSKPILFLVFLNFEIELETYAIAVLRFLLIHISQS